MKLYIKRKNFVNYLLVILFILSSGAFGVNKFISVFLLIYLAIALLAHFLFPNKSNSYNNILILGLIFFMVFLNTINMGSRIDYSKFILLLIFYMLGYFTMSQIRENDYMKCFVIIMTIEGILSLLVWSGNLFGLIELKSENILGFYYNHFFYHAIFGIRNSGVFWEPGAYQIFLNTALIFIFELEYKELAIKKSNIIKVILIIAVLSTQSTTGYIILMMILGYYTFFSKQIVKKSRHIIDYRIKKIIAIAIVIVTSWIIANSQIVQDKFSQENYSYKTRSNTWEISINMILDKPLLGYGYRSDNYTSSYAAMNARSSYNSSGILLFLCYFGIPFMTIYMWLIMKEIKRRKYLINKYYYFLILIIIFNSECVFTYPIIMFYMLRFKKENSNIHLNNILK